MAKEPNIDFFIKKMIRIGGSLAVTFPEDNVNYSGLKEGDLIKVYYRKVKKGEG